MSSPLPRNLPGLAAHLKLSVATVSFVLNGRAREKRISPRTEGRILDAARRFGVQPNRVAASLRSGRTGSIGLILPDIANSFFATLAQHIAQRLRESGDAVLLSDSAESAAIEAASLDDLRQRRVDGLIVAPVGDITPSLQALVTSGFPTVCIDRALPGLALPHVSIDHAGAARLAVETLVRAGHRHIGCLRARSGVPSDEERVQGYRDAMAAAGLPVRETWIAGRAYLREAAAAEARQLLAQSELTAIVPLAGQATLGLLEAMRATDRACPRDLSVVAFDEQPWCSLLNPPLSTVRQPLEDRASIAVAILRDRIAGRADLRHIRLPATVIERASVGPPRRRRIRPVFPSS